MHYIVIILCIGLYKTNATAQPYLDVANVRSLRSPIPGVSNSGGKIRYDNVSATIPIQFKNKDAFIISPYYERWNLSLKDSGSYKVHGWILPVSLFKNIRNTPWSLLTTFIIRTNKEHEDVSHSMQYGGAVIASYKQRENLTYKFGLYYNREFFGNFFMPLAGIDWKVNEKNNLFGVLPGSMTWEHKIHKWLYYGATFRAVTNSYRLLLRPVSLPPNIRRYVRIDDNQLGAFADIYLTKNIVINVEAGHSISRKIRKGYTENREVLFSNVIYDKDQSYLKASVAYRVRFR